MTEQLHLLCRDDQELIDAVEELLHGPLKKAVDIKAHLQATGRDYKLRWPVVHALSVWIGPPAEHYSLVEFRADYDAFIVDYPVLPQMVLDIGGAEPLLVVNSFCSSRLLDDLEGDEQAAAKKELDEYYPGGEGTDGYGAAKDVKQHHEDQQQSEQAHGLQVGDGPLNGEQATTEQRAADSEQHRKDSEQLNVEGGDLREADSRLQASATREEASNTQNVERAAVDEFRTSRVDENTGKRHEQDKDVARAMEGLNKSSLHQLDYDMLGDELRRSMPQKAAGGSGSVSPPSVSTDHESNDGSKLPGSNKPLRKFAGNAFARTKKAQEFAAQGQATKRKASEYEEDDPNCDEESIHSRKRLRTPDVLDGNASEAMSDGQLSRSDHRSPRAGTPPSPPNLALSEDRLADLEAQRRRLEAPEYDYEDDGEDEEEGDEDAHTVTQQTQTAASPLILDCGEDIEGLGDQGSAASAQIARSLAASGSGNGQQEASSPASVRPAGPMAAAPRSPKHS